MHVNIKEYKELMKIRDVCNFLEISRPTFYRLVKKGTFEIIKIKNCKYSYIKRKQLEHYIN